MLMERSNSGLMAPLCLSPTARMKLFRVFRQTRTYNIFHPIMDLRLQRHFRHHGAQSG